MAVHQKADGGYTVAGNTLMQGDTSAVNHIYLLSLDASGNSGCSQIPFDTVSTAIGTTVTSPNPAKSITSNSAAALTQVSNGTAEMSTICLNGVGIEEPERSSGKVKVYPNPSSGILTVSSGSVISDLRIFNALGQTIVSRRAGNEQLISLDLRDQPLGMYFYSVHTAEQRHETGVFIIR
jgi:hypothetical protein